MYSMFVALLAVVGFSYPLFSAEQTIPFTYQSTASYHDEWLNKKQYDGFCAGTLVKTPSGYTPIEALRIGDYILDPYHQPKKIEGVTLSWVPSYWRIKIGNEYISFGIRQPFYTQASGWRTIAETNEIFAADGSIVRLHEVELIEDATCLYVISVEDHMFCITPRDLVVHNAEALIIGALSIALENFAVPSAVIAAVQATLSLSFISYQALQEYCAQQEVHNKDFDAQELSQSTRRAERAYFEKRKQELENLRDEFLTIKNGLLSISTGCNGGINFISLFLQQHTFPTVVNPSNLVLMNEMQLSEDQYGKLRTTRDTYLSLVEEEITDVHLTIACHLNKVIENVKQARQSHEHVTNTTSTSIIAWNAMSNGTMPIDRTLQLKHYEYCLYDYYSLQKAIECLEELKTVINFYRGQPCRSCLVQTIPVRELLEKIKPFIAQHEEWILEEQYRITNNIAITEAYYMRNHIYDYPDWSEIKAAFEKQYEEGRKIQLVELHKQQESLKQKYKESKKSSQDGDEDPKNRRNNDKYENMYEVFARAPIGKRLKEAVERTSRCYKDSKMYRVIKDIKEVGIYKDDWLYLDKMHKDHIEVFTKNGKDLRTILNMDGTPNLTKIEQAGTRDILEWIR